MFTASLDTLDKYGYLDRLDMDKDGNRTAQSIADITARGSLVFVSRGEYADVINRVRTNGGAPFFPVSTESGREALRTFCSNGGHYTTVDMQHATCGNGGEL